MTKALTPAELFACNQWLFDWPEDIGFEEILRRLNNTTWVNADDGIVPWTLVENNTGSQIAQFIDDTRRAVTFLLKQEA